MKTILQKLHKVQQNLVVPKTKENKFGEFMYRSAEDILIAVKPLLKEHGLVLHFTDDVVQAGDKNYIRAVAFLTEIETGETMQTYAHAQEPGAPKPKMDASQTTGSTSSYARKYALNALFAIDDMKDSDTTNNKAEKPQAPKATPDQIAEILSVFNETQVATEIKTQKVAKIEDITQARAKAIISNPRFQELKKQKQGGGGNAEK